MYTGVGGGGGVREWWLMHILYRIARLTVSHSITLESFLCLCEAVIECYSIHG